MTYTIELEKLTDEQLEAFKIIDLNAYKNEKENRATYSDEETKNGQVWTDLDKAYFYLKPMYDNMRNTDVKKTITESGIMTTLEKIFRWAKKKEFKYERFSAPVVVEQPVAVEQPIPVPAPEKMPEPIPQPNPQATVVEDKVVIPATKTTIETMSTEELNKIMASIPAVEKI